MCKITFKKIISLYFELQDKLLSSFWRYRSQKSNINGHILMYHHVTDEVLDIIPSCIRTPEQFVTGLERERDNGYHFISIAEFIKVDETTNKKFCMITFDDVPSNFMTVAYPYLKENNIPFLLFITTSYLTDNTFLSVEQIKTLDKDPLCTIGAHTVSHPILRRCKEPRKELAESKIELENILGHSVDYLAYPYGKHSSVSRRIRTIAQKVGFVCAFSTIDAPVSDCSFKSKFFLPRMVI